MTKRLKPKPTRFLMANVFALLVCILMTRTLILPILEEQQSRLYQSQLSASANYISSFIQARKAEIRLLADLPELQSMDWPTIRPSLMSRLSDSQEDFEKFVLALPSGHAYTTSAGNPHHGGLISFNDDSPDAKLKNLKKRDYWRVTIDHNIDHQHVDYVSNPMVSYTTGIKQVMVASSIHKDGKVVGLLGGSISWSHITDLINDISTTFDDPCVKFFLVSKDGNYWYHWNQDKIISVRKDAQGKPLKNEIGEKSVLLHNILSEKSETMKSIGRNMVAGKSGVEEVVIDGQSQHLFYMPIENTNYSLAKVVESHCFLNVLHKVHIYFFVAFIAGMLIYLFFVYLVPKSSHGH